MPAKRTVTSATLIAKENLAPAQAAADTVEAWLRARDVSTRRFIHPADPLPGCLGKERDLILVFGGDGTVVSVSRHTLGMGIPIAGVNFGRVGFLTELTVDTWERALSGMLEQGLAVQPRMTLRYGLYREGLSLCGGEVVNDVVVTRGKVARLATLNLRVNDNPFISLRSDGLILSTPTGASGYAGSAGGPLLLPTLNAYIVAAICPYLSSFPPLVLSPDTKFSIHITEVASDLYLTLDGQETHAMRHGDLLEVWGKPERLFMADFGLKDYFERLRRAGFVQESKSCS